MGAMDSRPVGTSANPGEADEDVSHRESMAALAEELRVPLDDVRRV